MSKAKSKKVEEVKKELPGFCRPEWLLPEDVKRKIQKGILSGDRVVVRVPGRIDLAGGWNDTPPYNFDNEAAVLNTSVSFGNQWMVEVEVQRAEYFSFIENNYVQLPPIDHIVVIKVLEFLGLSLPPITISIKNTIPKGSGLGGSSLLASAVLSAIVAYALGAKFVIEHPGMIANGVLAIEQMIGSGGGWQDQIGGMMPGLKLIETTPASCSTYHITYINDLVADKLSSHSMVLNTGIRRKASNVLEPIRELYVKKDKKALQMLNEIRDLAKKSHEHLEAAVIKDFAETITLAWNKVVEVESRTTVPVVKEIMDLCGSDLLGLKIAGAGGGGFAILIFTSEDARNYHELKIQDSVPNGTVYRPTFGRSGLVIIQSGESHRMNKKEEI